MPRGGRRQGSGAKPQNVNRIKTGGRADQFHMRINRLLSLPQARELLVMRVGQLEETFAPLLASWQPPPMQGRKRLPRTKVPNARSPLPVQEGGGDGGPFHQLKMDEVEGVYPSS